MDHYRGQTTQTSNDYLQIHVRDTGPGIAPEDISKLFIPFKRLHTAVSQAKGTGLGLVISKRLLEAMNGTLSVKSALGQGSTFTIELPLAECPLEQLKALPESEDARAEMPPPESTCTVLYIEDTLSNLRLIEMILASRPEVTLLSAMQGSVGLDLAHQHEPDLILLDLHLPDMTGQEVLTGLQCSDITRDIPVIIISADATPTQIERLLDGGAKTYLTKPLNMAEFLRAVDEAFRDKEVLAKL